MDPSGTPGQLSHHHSAIATGRHPHPNSHLGLGGVQMAVAMTMFVSLGYSRYAVALLVLVVPFWIMVRNNSAEPKDTLLRI
ncbi:MAG: hypothetical protein OHK0012_21780 [Synechococcales cyanobacterium]